MAVGKNNQRSLTSTFLTQNGIFPVRISNQVLTIFEQNDSLLAQSIKIFQN